MKNCTFSVLVVFLFSFLSLNAQEWEQLGQNIEGSQTNERLGDQVSISEDGQTVALGNAFTPDNETGVVRIFRLINGSWLQLGSELRGDAEGDRFGQRLKLSGDGNSIIVSEYGNGSFTGDVPHVEVYRFINGDWQQVGNDISGPNNEGQFGIGLDISYDGGIIAASSNFNSGALIGGIALIFKFENGIWSQLGNTITGEASGDNFGWDLSLSSDGLKIAVGATEGDPNGNNTGYVKVFGFQNNFWVQLGSKILGSRKGFNFGKSVSISNLGNRVAIGAARWDFSDATEDDRGDVHVFELNNDWEQMGSIIKGKGDADLASEVSISGNGEFVAVGANRNSSFAGQIRAFIFDGSDWSQIGSDINGQPGNVLGGSIDLNEDGKKVLGGTKANHGKVFQFVPAIAETEIILNEDGQLIITDSNGGTSDDEFILTINGDKLRIQNIGNTISISGNGIQQIDENTVEVLLANITKGIEIDGAGGLNTLLIDSNLSLLGEGNDLTVRETDVLVTGTGNLQLNALNVYGGSEYDTNGLTTEIVTEANFFDGSAIVGTGTLLGTLNMNDLSTVAPGTSPGILNTGDLTFTADAAFEVEVNGPVPGAPDGHDQLIVTGTVELGGALLDINREIGSDYTGNPGDELILIENDGTDPVIGTFADLAEGAAINDDFVGTVSYMGGNGNDVVLLGPVEEPSGLIITEIMYNPLTESNGEWIEVYNMGFEPINLMGYVLDDNAGAGLSSANIPEFLLMPGKSVILYDDDLPEGQFTQDWGTVEAIAVANWPSLNNTGDTIGIWDNFEDYDGDNENQINVIEQVVYDAGSGWPNSSDGKSIFFIALEFDNTEGGSWSLSSINAGEEETPLFNSYESTQGDIGSPGTPNNSNSEAFITTWKTDNPGSSNDNQITIPYLPGATYNYTVDWGDGSSDSGVTGPFPKTHTYAAPGTYTVSITGEFPTINFGFGNDDEKILTIEQWGTNKWKFMHSSFAGCANLDVVTTDAPDLSQVTSLQAMFLQCSSLIGNNSFNSWDVSSIINMNNMFGQASSFNQDIGSWDVSSVTNMARMFSSTPFDKDIGDWDVSSVEDMTFMFGSANSFNQDIGSWDVSTVENMTSMFNSATNFNQDIGSWDVSHVQDISGMFSGATSFNQDIGGWDVSGITIFQNVFSGSSSFNQDIGSWNLSNAITTGGMFAGADSFNQDISTWDVSNVFDMSNMFEKAVSFNQNIDNWNVSNVELMLSIFQGAISFDQDLGNWDIGSVIEMRNAFRDAALSTENYDALLNGWAAQILQDDVIFDGGNSQYCAGTEARQKLIDDFGWTITDGGLVDDAIVLTCPENIVETSTNGNDLQLEIADATVSSDCLQDLTANGVRDDGMDLTDPYPVTTTTITWSAIDGEGQVLATCTQTVTVSSNGSMDNDMVLFSIPSQATGTRINLFDHTVKIEMPPNTDLSDLTPSVITVSEGAMVSPAAGVPRDFTDPVMYTVTAANGTIQEWTVEVTIVEDGVPPVIDCVEAIELNTDPGECLAAHQFEFPTATDDVDDPSLIVIEGSFNGSNSLPNSLQVGESTIIWTARDRSGNVAECVQVFTVVDNEDPTVVCQDFTVQLNAEGFADIIPENVDGGHSDNCGIDLISVSPLSFNEENIGENEVTIDVIDVNGNSSSCTALVTVEPFETSTFSVTGFTLIDADTDQPLFDLEDGMTIVIDDLPTLNLNIDVQTTEDVESLNLELSGAKSHTMTENNLPYALYGNDGPIDYHGSIFMPGTYTFTATPYSENQLGGEMGTVKTLSFEIVEGDPKPFVTTWKTDNPGASEDNQITIPTFPGETYNYSVDWGDGNSSSGVTGDITHTYETPGIYTVSITGDFPKIDFAIGLVDSFDKDNNKILSVEQWGDIAWSSMNWSFLDCSNLDVRAMDVPDLSDVSDMYGMFQGCTSLVGNSSFNNWNVGNVTNMPFLFNDATSFNQDISNWDVVNVTNMDFMFQRASNFNQDIGNWDVGNVTNMGGMFRDAVSFNQDIGNWDVGIVTNMGSMFTRAAAFDQDLGAWNVGNATNLAFMLESIGLSTENYDSLLIGWSELALQPNVTFDGGNSQYCAGEAARQHIIDNFGWTITDDGKTPDCPPAPISITKITLIDADTNQPLFDLEDGMIINLDDLPTLNLTIDVQATDDVESLRLALSGAKSHAMTENNPVYALYGNSGTDYHGSTFVLGTYTFTATPYSGNKLVGEMGTVKTINFEIVEGDPKPFVTTWKTDNPGASEDNQITIPTFPGETYNYNVDWGDGTSSLGVTGNITHTYDAAGTYQVSISGEFPRIYFNNLDYYTQFIGDELKLLMVEQWGDNVWSSMERAFAGCRNMDITAIDIPDLDLVTNAAEMFFLCNSLVGNSSFDTWEMGSVENMRFMFFGTIFNQNINSWDVGNVNRMDWMFADALFNQFIGDWDVSSVITMEGMFDYAVNFNQDIGNWDVSSVTNLSSMFNSFTVFDQDLSKWNVANVTNAKYMFWSEGLSNENYDRILIGWGQLPELQIGVELGAIYNQYCLGEEARQKLIDDFGWTIIDDGKTPDCPPAPLSVTKITLIDADTDQPLFDLEDGMRINISELPTLNLTIDVQATEDVESLQLELSGSKTQLKTENRAPFALFGNDGPDDFIGSTFELGTYTFTARPYSENFLGGEMGTPLSITFEIIDDLELNTLKISPNQATTLARASFERPTEVNQILIFDMSGRLIESYNPEYIRSGDDYILDVNFYQQGTYIVKMLDNRGVPYQKQMVVKRQ